MNLDKLKNISLSQEQQKVVAFAVLVIGFGGYAYVNVLYKPRLDRITALREELAKEDKLLKKIKDSIENIEKHQLKSQEVVRNLRRIKRRLPGEELVPEAMRGINKAVKMSGVHLNAFFKPPSKRGKGAAGGTNYSELATEITITCNYDGLAGFITELMRVPRMISCDRFLLTRSGGKGGRAGTLMARIGVKTYHYTAAPVR